MSETGEGHKSDDERTPASSKDEGNCEQKGSHKKRQYLYYYSLFNVQCCAPISKAHSLSVKMK